MTAEARDRDWMIPVTVIVLVELALWLVSFAAGHAYAPMITAYTGVAIAALVLVGGIRLLAALWRMRGTASPTAQLLSLACENPRRIVSILIGLQLVAIGSSAFGALKAAMPKTVAFWLDGPLAEFEHWLFAGHPWELTAALFGWATPAIELVYCTFVPGHLIATFAVLSAKPSELKSRAMISLFLIWLVLGVGGAYLLSSAGPIFYDRVFGGDTFAGLNETLQQAPISVWTADRLWQFHHLDVPIVANGISAMPSMHVGLTLWLALVLKDTKFAALGWVYFALIWLGSVHLGWHYAADGLVASLGVLLIWRVAPSFLSRNRPVHVAMTQHSIAPAGPVPAIDGRPNAL